MVRRANKKFRDATGGPGKNEAAQPKKELPEVARGPVGIKPETGKPSALPPQAQAAQQVASPIIRPGLGNGGAPHGLQNNTAAKAGVALGLAQSLTPHRKKGEAIAAAVSNRPMNPAVGLAQRYVCA